MSRPLSGQYRYPRTEKRSDEWQIEKKASIPPVDYDEPTTVTVPVEVWDSGPVLVTNTTNRQANTTYLPGEGRITSSLEEGSKVWKHKTRRKYYEDVKKPPRESSSTSRHSPTRSKKAIDYPGKTDEEKLVTTNDRRFKSYNSSKHLTKHHSGYDLKESKKESHIVKYVEDKSTQCNLKKPSKKKLEISQDFRVIKSGKDGSVTAYSDVSNLDDFTNGKKTFSSRNDDEFIVEKNATVIKHRQATPSPVRRTVVTKSYNLDAGNRFGPDVRPNASPGISEKRLKPSSDWYLRDRGYESPRPLHSARETIEETLSLSSSDEAIHTHRSKHDTAVKSILRELDDEKKVISYDNPRPRKRDILTESSVNTGNLWFKAPEDDYRRSMAQNDVSFNCIGVSKDPDEPTCRAFTPYKPDKSPISVLGTQSYTLDRKYIKDRQQGRTSGNGVVYRKAPSLPSGNEKDKLHRFSSSRDVSARSESGNETGFEYRRGGLAAAYKNRQERASSLNRTIGQQHMRSSTLSLGPSRTSIHENEPVVMYIPAVSHHRKPVDEEDDRLSGIQRSQSILSNRRGVKSSVGGGGVTWASHVKQNEGPEGQRGRDLKRSQSIPKDTKFPWLSRLRLRSKSKEP